MDLLEGLRSLNDWRNQLQSQFGYLVSDAAYPFTAVDPTDPANNKHRQASANEARLRLIGAIIRTGSEDKDAFREVYDLTSTKLFGICLRICKERQSAEDVLNEVYLIIWKRAGAYDPGQASPISWLATIARNRAIDWCRANPVRSTDTIEEAHWIVDPSPLASDSLELREESRRLQDCLDGLETKQGAAIRTAFFEGLTYSGLAEKESVPLGTMKSWVRRGLVRLKECLEGDG